MTLEEEIVAAEQRRFAATVRADAAELRECLGDELVYVHSNGVVEDREAFIAMLVSGQRRYLGFTPGARTLRLLGDAVASIGDLQVQGVAGTVHITGTAVYWRQPHWKMVLWHACGARKA